MQKLTSAGTSINSKKLPAIFKKPDVLSMIGQAEAVVDYGCGRYIDHIEKAVKAAGARRYLPIDPFNQADTVNDNSIGFAMLLRTARRPILCTCSNVLNVIDDDDVIADVIRKCCQLGTIAAFTVYEGNKTGAGRQTGADTFQRNLKTADYKRFFDMAGVHYIGRRAGVLYASL